MEKKKSPNQLEKFVEAARELGCDEDEAHFEEKLKKVARHKPEKETGSKGGTKKPSEPSRT